MVEHAKVESVFVTVTGPATFAKNRFAIIVGTDIAMLTVLAFATKVGLALHVTTSLFLLSR